MILQVKLGSNSIMKCQYQNKWVPQVCIQGILSALAEH